MLISLQKAIDNRLHASFLSSSLRSGSKQQGCIYEDNSALARIVASPCYDPRIDSPLDLSAAFECFMRHLDYFYLCY
jgi:hypothetical protein